MSYWHARLEDTIDEGTLGKILPFVEERFHGW